MFKDEPPPSNRPPHPECVKMHKLGYCVCTMVECGHCGTFHPPHKKCPEPKEKK